MGILSVRRCEVVRALDAAVDTLEAVGLRTHETDVTDTAVELLGVELNAELGCTRLSEKRYWRLERGLEAALARTRMSGEVLSILVGQCTFAGLVFRQSLCV